MVSGLRLVLCHGLMVGTTTIREIFSRQPLPLGLVGALKLNVGIAFNPSGMRLWTEQIKLPEVDVELFFRRWVRGLMGLIYGDIPKHSWLWGVNGY